jgi:AcrR family transcriptional regulator
MREYALANGDTVYDSPEQSLALMWGPPPGRRRGKVPTFTVAEVVGAAIKVADREGLASVSMRRIADELQLTPMALYTYVPSKSVLVSAMIEEVSVEVADLPDPGGSWRERIAAVAWANWRLYLGHPWLLSVTARRAVAGPNRLRKAELEYRALKHEGIDLLHLHDLVEAYVYGAARAGVEEQEARSGRRPTATEWWEAHEPYLDQILDRARYPELATVLTNAMVSKWEPEAAFAFGLERLLDGLEALANAVAEKA